MATTPTLTLNQVLLSGILYQLRYELAAHEGLMLNCFEADHPEMQVFNIGEGFKSIMEYAFEAIEYLSEHELKTGEDVKNFTGKFDDPVRNTAVAKAVDYVLANGWEKELGKA